MSWFRKAAEQGAFNRYHNLGFLYENGGYGLPKNYVQAYVWYSLEIPLYSDVSMIYTASGLRRR